MPVHSFAPLRGRVETFTIHSAALRGNLLGDPSEREVAVHLPEGYDHSKVEYPLVVELASFGNSGLKRTGWQAFGESTPQRLERLAARGAMGPVVAVFPDCFTSLGGNQYIDSIVTGRWETFLVEELLPEVERRFRVRRSPAARAVLGRSSGGYGALVQGLRHGERWGAVACHSGDLGFELLHRRDLARALDVLAEHGGNVLQFVERVREAQRIEQREMDALLILAMAASYDPDPSAPLGVRLPVDTHTAALDPERWARWLEHDPLSLIDRSECRKSLSRLAGLFIDCGTRDPYLLHYGARAFVRRLAEQGIAHRYEEFDDGHSGIDYRLDESLPFLYGVIAAE
jgi:enterochelin esterase-like enzyme